MIDYHGHVATLKVLRESLAAATAGTPYAAAWLATEEAVAAEPSSATLGALLDHLLERADEPRPERDLLEGGAALYKEARDILATVASLRGRFEGMVHDPATAELAQFIEWRGQLEALQPKLNALVKRFMAYQQRARPPFRHVARHAIAEDQPVAGWLWRDVTLSRRSDALIRALHDTRDGTPATAAFAFGALAGYAANAKGSSFIAHAVGGPRRSHPIRDRVARYATGAWFRLHEPTLCTSLTQLRADLTFGDSASPKLPAALRTQIENRPRRDLPAGCSGHSARPRRGVRRAPAPPRAPGIVPAPATGRRITGSLLVRVMQSPDATKTLLKPTDWNWPDPHDGTVPPMAPTPGSPTPGNDTKSDGGCGVLGAILLAITIVGLIIYKLATGRWPWETDPPAQTPGTSQEALTAFVQSDDALTMVPFLYHLHNTINETASVGVRYLKRIGLLYPEESDLAESMFSQFTQLSTFDSDTIHPHRPLPDPAIDFENWPTSPIEEPSRWPSLFSAGATPGAFLRDGQGPPEATVESGGVDLWHQQQDVGPSDGGINLNLDADRGYDDHCWRVRPGASITTNPIPVEALAYSDVE